MRIVIAGYHPADPAEIHGGVEAITLRLVEGLAQLGGHELHVVTTRRELRHPQTQSFDGRTVHLLPGSPLLGNVTLMWPDRRRLRRLFRRLEPDIIHAHSATEFALAALESGFPTVVSIHGIAREEAKLTRGFAERVRGYFRTALEDRVLAKAREVMIVSPYVEETFSHLFAHARTHTVETSVSEIFFQVERERESRKTVLFAGLIIPRKGVVELVGAAREVCRRHPDVEFRLAGEESDAGYAEEVRGAIAAGDLGENVKLLGGLSPRELVNECGKASLLTLPSFQETAPIAIQEAMAAGLPVVATDVGGDRYLVKEGETGHLVPAGDVEALAAAVTALLDQPEKARRMGARGREEARRRFAPRAVAERSVSVYEAVIARGGRGPGR